MSRADAELPWYFGSASKTWQGDAGLRSSLGAQLANPGASSSGANMSAIEDAMLRRCGAAGLARDVETRLRTLSKVQVEALRLHYTGSLPIVDPAACLLTSARRLLVSLQYRDARAALGKVRKARKSKDLLTEHQWIGVFLRARGMARELRRRRTHVLEPEILRHALHDARPAERAEIAVQAANLVATAKAAYDAVRIERSRHVQIDDPRRQR